MNRRNGDSVYPKGEFYVKGKQTHKPVRNIIIILCNSVLQQLRGFSQFPSQQSCEVGTVTHV